MNLSKRLKTIQNFIDNDVRVVDVGCDHALLDIYLTLNRNIKCVASDINEQALNIAKKNIKKYNLENKIDVILSDGLDNIKLLENDVIVISGMGTKTIINILKNKNLKTQKLIIQSNTEIFLLRKQLKKLGYRVIDEAVCFEKGKYYPTIFYEKGVEVKNILIGDLLYKENGKEYVEFLINKLSNTYSKMPFSFEKIKLKSKILFLKKSLRKYLRNSR
ncbi:MAG: SAM-dependent methyltransferase [Bacilli bacterium]|nr:SAM-dependent methyltransferase [Bacilli bacterium]